LPLAVTAALAGAISAALAEAVTATTALAATPITLAATAITTPLTAAALAIPTPLATSGVVPERVHVSGQHVLSGRVPRRVDRHVRGHGSPGQPRGVQGAVRQPVGMPVDRVLPQCYLLTLRHGGQRRGRHHHERGRIAVRVHDRHVFERGATQPVREARVHLPIPAAIAGAVSADMPLHADDWRHQMVQWRIQLVSRFRLW